MTRKRARTKKTKRLATARKATSATKRTSKKKTTTRSKRQATATRGRKQSSKKNGSKPRIKRAMAAAQDPLGACFFVDQFGQNVCQQMTKSACAAIQGGRFVAGGRCI